MQAYLKLCKNVNSLGPSLHNLKVFIFYVAISICKARGRITFHEKLKNNKTHSTESIPQEALVTGRRVRLGLEMRSEGAPNPPDWREHNTNPLVRCWLQSGEILPPSICLPGSPRFPNIHKFYNK